MTACSVKGTKYIALRQMLIEMSAASATSLHLLKTRGLVFAKFICCKLPRFDGCPFSFVGLWHPVDFSNIITIINIECSTFAA